MACHDNISYVDVHVLELLLPLLFTIGRKCCTTVPPGDGMLPRG